MPEPRCQRPGARGEKPEAREVEKRAMCKRVTAGDAESEMCERLEARRAEREAEEAKARAGGAGRTRVADSMTTGEITISGIVTEVLERFLECAKAELERLRLENPRTAKISMAVGEARRCAKAGEATEPEMPEKA